jgi:nicotinamidase-related amidase
MSKDPENENEPSNRSGFDPPYHWVTVMTLSGRVGRTLSLALALGLALALYGAPASAEQLPPAPSPVPVTLDPSTTALIVLDITTQTCSPQASCTAMLPRVASLLASARNAGVFVVYSTPATVPPILPEVAPLEGDPSVAGLGQDRFFDTPLDELLRAKGITHLILVGWRADGSVLYTSVGATLRTYTVVVPMDGTAASQDYDLAVGWYQMLTQLSANATNEPLKKSAVTLSRIDMITFRAGG